MRRIGVFFGLLALLCGPAGRGQGPGPGASYRLAAYRAAAVRDIRYTLTFHLPAARASPVSGEERLYFRLGPGWRGGQPLWLDFKTPDNAVRRLLVNGVPADVACRNEHLALPAKLLHKGGNTVVAAFTAGDPALSYLHHPLRTATSEKYLPATLEWLEDIQRTGDVFFPQGWLQASLSYYRSASAAAIVRRFLQTHSNYDPRLKAKILQAADNLFRVVRE